PITAGRTEAERVRRVVTFTGQSLGAVRGTPLLLLGGGATDFVPPPPRFAPRPAAGRSQGIALEHGDGRVVVLAEAAAWTAQVDDHGHRFGMQLPTNDNARFALNVMRWLAGADRARR
ncbi:MAG TPA: hypothetical protein VEA99_19425, partial [Gemmatimonadaceae bacterium]|nr:hypothetical protein [Gemmatimonadaceae bacterium]